jgi:hypothetical protein
LLLIGKYRFSREQKNCYYIEYKETLVGDVSLRENAETCQRKGNGEG